MTSPGERLWALTPNAGRAPSAGWPRSEVTRQALGLVEAVYEAL
ncbi:hypothetical protein [Streptomyces sp. NPDC018000]